MTKPKEDNIDLDKILTELGQFGRYQIQNYCIILLPILFSAVYNSQYIFAAAAVPLRCQVPECETAPFQYDAGSWASFTLGADGRCNRLRPLASATCTAESFHPSELVPCTAWVYQHNDTIVSEFDLGCQEWKRTLVGTIHSTGLFFALPLTGYISDTFGRRTAFILTAVSVAVMGLIRSFSPNYIMYMVFEFLDATLGSGVYSTGFLLALEMVGLNKRVLGGNIISCTYALGQVCVALVAWAIPEWRMLTRVLYAPSLIFVVYILFLEESVRWLLSKGNKKEAARIIFKAAAVNKKKLSPETIKQLTEDEPSKQHIEAEPPKPADITEIEKKTFKEVIPSHEHAKPTGLVMKVLKSRIIMTRLFICSFWWMSVTFIYYGLSINSVSLAGNSYMNYILTSLVEIPGYCASVLTLDRFGRKSSIMAAFFICGISLIGLPFVPSTVIWAATTLNMVGKLCISMTFSSIYIYTSELFPTYARHSLLGFCSMVGRIGSIVAPQTPLLMEYWNALPYLLFGAMAISSGILMLFTPETLRMRLPDTIEQAENIAVAPRVRHQRTDVLVD